MKGVLKSGLAVAAALLVVVSGPVAAKQVWKQGDMAVRLGASGVFPSVNTDSKGGALTDAGMLDNTRVRVGNDYKPTFTFSYFLTDNIDVEVLGAWPFKSNVKLRGGPLNGTDFGSAHYLPPSITFNYHFETGTNFVPYAGAGVNYTFFFNQSVHDEAAGAGVDKFRLKNSFNPTAQVGFDYFLTRNLFVNANVRYIHMNTKAHIDSAVGRDKVNLHLDPWIYSANLGWRF